MSWSGLPRRRDLVRTATLVPASLAGLTVLGASNKGGGRVIKVGLIGCGGRGNGALLQHMQAAEILNRRLDLGLTMQVSAVADFFPHKARPTGEKYEVPRARWFSGPDAYRKLIETDVEIVLIATPPVFRPIQVEAAVRAGKHVFMEKPAAVDPVGCRRVIAAGQIARQKGLVVVAGTLCRHIREFIETQAAVAEGAIGKVVSGRIASCMGLLGAVQPIGPLDPGRLAYTWSNWTEMSGDHIVEAHIHEIDIMHWFMGAPPVSAAGFGGRARRAAGNQYDFFSVDYEYPNGVHIHSICRQINNCWNAMGVRFVGEKGTTNGRGDVRPQRGMSREIPQWGSGYDQEQINLLYCIAKGRPLNQAGELAVSTAAAVMGRMSAYTGQRVTWSEMMEDPKQNPELYDLQLRPTAEDFERETCPMPREGVVPVPGRDA